MTTTTQLNQYYVQAKVNRWFRRFTVFCRVALAAGFIPAGVVKIMGERFTSLSINHPMGNYLEALSHTGYYYPFIGIIQIMAALLLLIPRTATLGALLYFPIIFNIFMLSMALRFDGSAVTSPLMVLANLYLLCWDWDKLKYIVWRKELATQPKVLSNKFPISFVTGVVAIMVAVALLINSYDIVPHNTLRDCNAQCSRNKNRKACKVFCECIHTKGQPLDKSLDEYDKAK